MNTTRAFGTVKVVLSRVLFATFLKFEIWMKFALLLGLE
jgi:hypothetical protein